MSSLNNHNCVERSASVFVYIDAFNFDNNDNVTTVNYDNNDNK